jgi:hypothetical protein
MSDITWSDIDFGSQHIPKTEEERRRGIPDAPPEVTNIEIQEFAIEHFPEGPAAAIEPQKAWLAYKQSVAAEKAALPFEKQFFFQSKQPMPELAKRWSAFVADWCRRDFDLWLSQQRSVAHVDFRKGINLGRVMANARPGLSRSASAHSLHEGAGIPKTIVRGRPFMARRRRSRA